MPNPGGSFCCKSEDGTDFQFDDIAEIPESQVPVVESYEAIDRPRTPQAMIDESESARWQETKESLRKEMLAEYENLRQELMAEIEAKMVSKEQLLLELQALGEGSTIVGVLSNVVNSVASKSVKGGDTDGELEQVEVPVEIDLVRSVKRSTSKFQGSTSKLQNSASMLEDSPKLASSPQLGEEHPRKSAYVRGLTKGSTFVGDHSSQKRNSVGELCMAQQSDGVPILDAHANEMGAQDWVYNWAETMWDAMPFLGLGVMTTSDSVLVVLIAVLNLAIQAAFIGLVGANMTENFYDDKLVGTLQDWRVSYAHNPDFADKFTSTPLGSDVCSQSTFLMQGAAQAGLYDEVLVYIRGFLGMPAGACLSILSIFLWILTCCKEMKRIALFTLGLWTRNTESNSAERGSHVLIVERTVLWVYGEVTQKKYQLFITQCRVVSLSFLVLLPRLLILLSLGYVGSQHLVSTTELDELILNCVALEVVLNVDELLFTIFVPDSAARMVRKTRPLRVPKLRGIQAKVMPWVRVVVVGALMTAIAFGSLSPMIDTMKDVENVMCGGKVDFLAVEMEFGTVVSGTPQTSGIDRSSYRYLAIYERTGLQASSQESMALTFENKPFEFTKVQTMDEWRDRGIEKWANLAYDDDTFIPCANEYYPVYRNPQLKTAFWEGLSSKVGIKGLSSCDQVKPLCFNDSGSVGKSVRLLCPSTCGGGSALSGLLADTTADGNPAECKGWLSDDLSKVPCHDHPLHVLTNVSTEIGQGWKNYAVSVASVMSPVFATMSLGNETHFKILLNKLSIGMSTQGCDFFSRQSPTQGKTMYFSAAGNPYPIDFCDVSDVRLQGRRSIRPFCPQACECHTKVKQRYATLGETSWNERVGLESQCPGKCWTSTIP